MPPACSPSNKPIGGSKIGCTGVAMSRMARRCPAWVRISGAPQALAALNGGVLALPGLAPRTQCGFSDAAFLRSSLGSLAVTVWQAFAGVRVHQKALALPVSQCTDRHRVHASRARLLSSAARSE